MIAWEEILAKERPRLFALAYRMLGSGAQAEDLLQEAFLRVRTEAEPRSPEALLTTVVTRLALDVLKSARRTREEYVGPWLPEPVLTGDGASPYETTERKETLRVGFLLLLERLTPMERAVFVLREAFDYEWDELSLVLGRSPVALRKILQRAREHVGEERKKARPEEEIAVAAQFLGAMAAGDLAGVERLLAPAAVATSDSGGHVSAARKVVHGADVARLLVGLGQKAASGLESRFEEINGAPGILMLVGGNVWGTLVVEVEGGLVTAIRITLSPEKLGWIARGLGRGVRPKEFPKRPGQAP